MQVRYCALVHMNSVRQVRNGPYYLSDELNGRLGRFKSDIRCQLYSDTKEDHPRACSKLENVKRVLIIVSKDRFDYVVQPLVYLPLV